MLFGGHEALGRGAATALAILLAAALASATLSGCHPSTPELTVQEFINYRMEGDESRAKKLTVEGDLREYLGGEPYLAGSEVNFTTEQMESERDRAVVRVHFSWGNEEVDISYVCRRVKSRWKVSLRETEALWYPEMELEEQSTNPSD